MKRMIDNKEFEALKNDVKEIEAHTTDYVITSVVLDDGVVLGSTVKDVENDVSYNLPLGSQVEANPTLEGTEDALESIEIDAIKYKISGGSTLYQHNLELVYQGHNYNLEIRNESDTLINTPTKLKDWFNSKFKNKPYRMAGWNLITTTAYLIVKSIKVNNNSIYVSGLQVDNGTPTSQTSYAITEDFASFSITDNVLPL